MNRKKEVLKKFTNLVEVTEMVHKNSPAYFDIMDLLEDSFREGYLHAMDLVETQDNMSFKLLEEELRKI